MASSRFRHYRFDASPTLVALVAMTALAACGGTRSRPSGAAMPVRAPGVSTTAPGTVGAGVEIATWDSAACPALAGATADSARRITGSSQSTRSGERPEIILCASVGAREIRFATQPEISVRLTGALGDSVRVLERRNLPRQVQAGATYRNVYIAVQLLGHLVSSCSQQAQGDTARAAAASSLCADIMRADTARRQR